jgi:hypothetical protein
MRTEIIEILQKKYPEYCMQHIDAADEILCLFGISNQRELLMDFLKDRDGTVYACDENDVDRYVKNNS